MKMSTCFTLLFLGMLLPQAHAEDAYWFLSAGEQLMNPTSCTLYLADPLQKKAVKKVELSPRRNTRLVQTAGDQFAIWQYADEGHRQRGDAGYLIAGNTEMLENMSETTLPFEPVFGGYWYDGSQGLDIISRGSSATAEEMLSNDNYHSTFLFNVQSGGGESVALTQISWDQCILEGANSFRDMGVQLLNVEIGSDGEMFACFGRTRVPVSLQLGKEQMDLLDDPTKRLSIFCLDSNTCVLHTRNTVPGFLILDRKSGTWKYVVLRSGTARWQMFDEYLVAQELESEFENDPSPSKFAGVYRFYDRAGNELFVWTTTPDTELIQVWGSEILLKRGTEIYRGQIEDGVVGVEELICSGEEFQNVHWAFKVF